MTYQIACEPDETSDSLVIFKQHIGLAGRSVLEVGYSSTGLIGARIDGQVWGDLTSIEKHEERAVDFQLLQNYPNPFNPTTIIDFSMQESTMVTMRIYDVRGRLVATILDRKMDKGNHSVVFDATNYPGGIYFCHLQTTAGQKSVRKMLLIK